MHIGIFDSGIGGLTVLKALRAAWPGHSTVYLGDTARVPYGSKSPETVARYARQNAQYLISQGIELLVIACNTASAAGLEPLQAELPIPVVGVIEPGATAALTALETRPAAPARIGVIGTAATIASGAYERALHARRPEIEVLTRACPLFVPLVEEGWEATPVARAIAQQYLGPWFGGAGGEAAGEAAITALVLGCTHYPVLKPVLQELFGAGVVLIDSAEATALAVAPWLAHAAREAEPTHRYVVTDGAPGFGAIAARLLGQPSVELEVIDLTPLAF